MQRLGAIKLKTAVTPWGAEWPQAPLLTKDGVCPEGLDTAGQQTAWNYQFPGSVQMVIFVGTSVSSKKCQENKYERWEANKARRGQPAVAGAHTVKRRRTHELTDVKWCAR